MLNQEMINYWKKSACEDIITAEGLFQLERYLPCLFYCHLFLEKIIKALVVKDTGKTAPFGHKLTRLVKFISSVNFTPEQLDLLDEVTAFNIKARYEDYKFAVHKKATQEYTQDYLTKTKAFYLWLQEKL